MSGRCAAALVVVLAAGGCAIPSRSNVHDPKNTPDVSARIVDYTAEDGTCPATVDTGTAVAVESVSRGRCLAVDATGSRTAGGSPLTRGFTYTLLDGAGAEIPLGPAITGSGATAILDDAFRHTAPVNVPLRIRVDASHEGAHDRAEVSLLLRNAAPVAAGSIPRSIPLGGFTWAPGPTATVTFDTHLSTDADGDSLRQCWTFGAGATETCFTRGDLAPKTFAVPAGTIGRFLATVRVDDADCTSATNCPPSGTSSAPVTHVVDVHELNLWLSEKTTGSGDRLERLESATVSLVVGPDTDSITADSLMPATVDGEPGVAVLYVDQTSTAHVVVRTLDAADPPPTSVTVASFSPNTPVGSPRIAVSADGTIVSHYDPVSQVLRTFDVGAGGALAERPQVTVTSAPPDSSMGGSLFFLQHAVDAAGGSWLASRQLPVPKFDYVGVLVHVDEDGNQAIVTSNGRIDFTGLAARPGTNEIWASSIAAGGFGAPREPGIDVWDGQSSRHVDTGPDGLTAIAFAGRDDLWAAVLGEGLHLLDAAALDAGATFDEAMRATVPVAGFVWWLQADAQTADVVGELADPSGFYVIRATPGGDLSLHGTPVDFYRPSLFFEPQGRLLRTTRQGTAGGGRVAVSRAAGESDVITTVAFAKQADSFSYGFEQPTGGIWFPTIEPAGLLHLAQDGTPIAWHLGLLENGEPSGMPRASSLKVTLDGTHAWMLVGAYPTIQGWSRLDLTTSPPTRTRMTPGTSGFFSLWSVFLESSPSAATPFAWVIESNPTPHLGTTPVDTFVFNDHMALPTAPQRNGLSLQPKSNDLCMALRDLSGAGEYDLSRVRVPPAAAIPLASVAVTNAGSAQPAVTASWSDATGETCWFAVNLSDAATPDVRLLAYDATGALQHDATFAGLGPAGAMIAVARDSVWLSTGNPRSKSRVDFTAVGTATVSTRPATLSSNFLGPGQGP